MPAQPVAFGPFLLNPDNGTLFRDGELVAIGQKGALLLAALLKRPGQVLTKAELMDAAWPGTAVEESNLSVQIASLRKLLGPSPDGGEWIATIPRVGYRFVGVVDAPKSATGSSSNIARWRFPDRSPRSRSCPSPTSATIPNRNTSPMV